MGQVCSVCRFWDVVPLTDLNEDDLRAAVRPANTYDYCHRLWGARHVIPALFVGPYGHQLIGDASDKAI